MEQFGQRRHHPPVARAEHQARPQHCAARFQHRAFGGQAGTAGRGDRRGFDLAHARAGVRSGPVHGGGGELDDPADTRPYRLIHEGGGATDVDERAALRVPADVGGEVQQDVGAFADTAQGGGVGEVGGAPFDGGGRVRLWGLVGLWGPGGPRGPDGLGRPGRLL